MNKSILITVSALLVSSGCFSTHDGEDDAELREPKPAAKPGPARPGNEPREAVDSGRVPAGRDSGQAVAMSRDAGVPSSNMPGDDPPSGTQPGLQVWLGAVNLPNGNGLGCGPIVAGPGQQRALLLLELDPRGQLTGASLTLGEGPPLPQVEDPNAYYPPGPPWDWHGCPMLGFVPGFEYPLYDVRLSAIRLAASVHPADVTKEWCELQPSYRASPVAAEEWGAYLCRPTDQIKDISELSEAIPHSNAPGPSPFFPEELCFNVNAPCICDADSCTASPYGAAHLDVQLQGDVMTGRFARMDIKLERQR